MVGPSAISATALAKEVGVSQAQLCRWKNKALTMGAMVPDEKPTSPKSPRAWTAKEKLRLVATAASLEGEALGALLRSEGVHLEQLEAWRQMAEGALAEGAEPKMTSAEAKATKKKVKELERELRRKEKALAETAALLVLKKKMEAFWEEEDAGTDGEPEK
jgi:transposase